MRNARIPMLALIEASYRVEQSSQQWLHGVIQTSAEALDDGMGVCGYFVDLRDGGFQSSGYQGTKLMGTESGQAAFVSWNASVPTELKRYSTMNATPGTIRAITRNLRARTDAPSEVGLLESSHGFPEMRGVNAIDADLLGCSLAAPLARRATTALRMEAWARVAVHMCAGARLLRKLSEQHRSLVNDAEAILDPSGRVLHANGDAKSRIAREALRDAAISIDYARARESRLSEDELALAWQALYLGRWTMLESFDTDGRRYFIASPNAPRGQLRTSKLSAREAQVVRTAALGHSNKVIAYELGLTVSTISTLLVRAMKKLRVSSRVALIRKIINEEGVPPESQALTPTS